MKFSLKPSIVSLFHQIFIWRAFPGNTWHDRKKIGAVFWIQPVWSFLSIHLLHFRLCLSSLFNVMVVLLTYFFSRLSFWGLAGGNQQIPVTEGSKLIVAFPSLLSSCIRAGLCHLSCWFVWTQTFLTGSVASLRGIRTTEHHNQPSHMLLFSHVSVTVGVTVSPVIVSNFDQKCLYKTSAFIYIFMVWQFSS